MAQIPLPRSSVPAALKRAWQAQLYQPTPVKTWAPTSQGKGLVQRRPGPLLPSRLPAEWRQGEEAAELRGHVGKSLLHLTEAEASQLHKETELLETPRPGGRQAAWLDLWTLLDRPCPHPLLWARPPC